jgi:hypothetical protein
MGPAPSSGGNETGRAGSFASQGWRESNPDLLSNRFLAGVIVHHERQSDARAAAARESSLSRPAGVVVRRRRLVEALEVGQPLTLVCAPAGYGKSVLVECWVAAGGEVCTVARTALDEDAVEPRAFWASAVDSLRDSGVDVSGWP